jgi:AraC-like DNA-binding protein
VLPAWNGLLAPIAAGAFADLGLSAALWQVRDNWHAIHAVRDLGNVEQDCGFGPPRWAYNFRCFGEVKRTRKPLLGSHFGVHDWFVPILGGERIHAILVTGPFVLKRPSASDLLERWHALSGRQGRLSDPQFAEYVTSALSVLTLDATAHQRFQRLLHCLVGLFTQQGSPERLFAEFQALRAELMRVRTAEQMWAAVRALIDERYGPNFPMHAEAALHDMGMASAPRHVVVGLLRGREREPDALDELVRRDAFQRACCELALDRDATASGPLGHHGVVFVVDDSGPGARVRVGLNDLAARVAALAKRYELSLHAGITQDDGSTTALPHRYQRALWTAEKALSESTGILHSTREPRSSGDVLRELRAEIADSIKQQPSLLVPRFDRYVQAVLAHVGYRLERTQGELLAGVERLTEPLLAAGLIQRKSHREMLHALEQRAEAARTVAELLECYRAHIADLQGALEAPSEARRERGTRRAATFMQEHYGEPLRMAQVARVAGFAPDYFSRLFKRDEGTTPELYLRRWRVERAKEMLLGTKLSLDAVRKLCGFRTRSYFHRAFKELAQCTPLEYRKQTDKTRN